MRHRNQTLQCHISYNTTAWQSTRKGPQYIGIPRTMTMFVVYTGIHMFAKTRKRQLIDMLHGNGLSISYTRVLEISAQLGEAVVVQYVEDGVVCPPVLRKKLFTSSAVDNIDHNPTATMYSKDIIPWDQHFHLPASKFRTVW